MQPAVADDRRGLLRPVVVADHHVRAAGHDLAVDRLHLGAGEGLAAGSQLDLPQPREGDHRRALGHPVAFADGEAQDVEDPRGLLAQRGAAADQVLQPAAELAVHRAEDQPREARRADLGRQREQRPRQAAGLDPVAEGVAQHVVEARHADDRRHLVALERRDQLLPEQGRREDDRRAAEQRRHQAAGQRQDVVQREQQEDPRGGGVVPLVHDRRHVGQEVSERQHHPLRAAGRAGGVDDRGQRGRVGVDRFRGCGLRTGSVPAPFHVEQPRPVRRQRERPFDDRSRLRRAVDRARPAVVEDVGDLLRGRHEVEGDQDLPRAPDRVGRVDPLEPVLGEDDDALVGSAEIARPGAGAAQQLVVADAIVVPDQRGRRAGLEEGGHRRALRGAVRVWSGAYRRSTAPVPGRAKPRKRGP